VLTLDTTFEPLHEIPVADLFGAVGVYTIWARGATHRPTYMGEGIILDRISKHVKRWRTDMLGTAAILSDAGPHRDLAKPGGLLAEAFFLELGELLGRKPLQNDAPGHVQLLRTAVEIHNIVRINVRGLHPFMHPENPRARLSERAVCTVELNDYDEFVFTTPWNARAVRRSSRNR